MRGHAMFSSPRPIFFSTELETPPNKDWAIARESARALYVKLAEPGGYRYENLDMQITSPLLSTRRGEEGRSVCQIGRYAVRIEEVNPEMPVDQFVKVVKEVLQAMGNSCPPFFMQRCKIQCLSQTNVFPHPLGILASRIGNVSDKIAPFGRPPTFFGVRFGFSPYSEDDEEEEGGENEHG